jgi:hypothetical protein
MPLIAAADDDRDVDAHGPHVADLPSGGVQHRCIETLPTGPGERLA